MISVSDSPLANELAIRRLLTVEMQLLAWIQLTEVKRAPRAMHLRRGGYEVYVRRAERRLIGISCRAVTLDIASVQLAPRLQGRRWFRGFLELVDALNPWDATYVECVHNTRLAGHLARSGYALEHGISYYIPSSRWRSLHPGARWPALHCESKT